MRILSLCRQKSTWLPLLLAMALGATSAMAVPLPGGTLDPLTIPKYVQPLVIPPVMPASTVQPAALNPDGTPILDDLGNPVAVPAADYNIAVRQFSQQILPGGIWNTVNLRADAFPPTPIWSYGSAEDDPVAVSNYVAPAPLGPGVPTFNYPALTVEATVNATNSVRWINDLKDPTTGAFLPHLLTGTVDQTLHWANPPNTGCVNAPAFLQIDCNTYNPAPYAGPVPIVTHVHGAHVNSNSDGYPEAWWLANASNIPAGYATTGTLFTQQDTVGGVAQDPQYRNADGTPMAPIQQDFDPVGGAAFYSYENTQAATTLWYHDHTLGMTRLNVYAGPAGFWLLRGGAHDLPGAPGNTSILPGPAPVAGEDPNFIAADRTKVREIPIAIQDRSFNADGTLFYPQSRAFFDGFMGPYVGGPTIIDPITGLPVQGSDINPIWNPEAFFNTMVVNGTTWPVLEVAPAKYRLRLLNGSNSRFINLSMFEVVIDKADKKNPKKKDNTKYGLEHPFYQIGGDQGFLPKVVQIQTGMATVLPGTGMAGVPVMLPDPMQALLMAPAERADVIVDFSNLPDGTIIRMLNTAPDAPFGGFPDIPADSATTGQVMQFVVNSVNVPLTAADAAATPVLDLVLPVEPPLAGTSSVTRPLSLNEEESMQICVTVSPTGAVTTVGQFPPHTINIAAECAALGAVPQAPKAALLGTVAIDPTLPGSPIVGVPAMWKDPITEIPVLGATETWEFYNLTVDGHPIHMHLVGYEIINRQLFDPISLAPIGPPIPPLANELGRKDTVLAYPGEVTRVKATFDLPGLYVWHCHIVEHEDNEMMRPLYVNDPLAPGYIPDAVPVGFPRP